MVRMSFLFGAAVAAGFAVTALSPQALAQGVVDAWSSVKPPPPPVLKTVKVDPQTTALLVMDFIQPTCRPDKRVRCFQAIPKVKDLLDKARAHHMLVVYTRGPNSPASDFVKELAPIKGEQMFAGHANKFEGNDLDKTLKAHGIKTIIATGTSPNGAVIFTAAGAASLGYKLLVPVDTMPGDTAYAEQISIWGIANDPGLREASTLTSVDRITF